MGGRGSDEDDKQVQSSRWAAPDSAVLRSGRQPGTAWLDHGEDWSSPLCFNSVLG